MMAICVVCKEYFTPKCPEIIKCSPCRKDERKYPSSIDWSFDFFNLFGIPDERFPPGERLLHDRENHNTSDHFYLFLRDGQCRCFKR